MEHLILWSERNANVPALAWIYGVAGVYRERLFLLVPLRFGYHFKVGLDFQHYKASLDGEHSGFPSFTVKVGGVPIYQWEQTNIFGLFAPMVHAHVTSADW